MGGDMVPTVDIRDDLLARHTQALDTLRELSRRHGPGRWVLVGGLMVLLIGREYGARAPRAEATKDADILIDIVAKPGLLGEVTSFLSSAGYTLQDGLGTDERAARCSFEFGKAQIDVLCPDDTPAGALEVPDSNVASIAIPGGRRALQTARLMNLRYTDDADADVFVPTLAGALAVKAASAVDPRTAGGVRHIQDIAFLLTIGAKPGETLRDLNEADLSLLRHIEPDVADSRSPMWDQLDDDQRQRARAMYTTLIS